MTENNENTIMKTESLSLTQSELRAKEPKSDNEVPDIPDFFKDATVFLTGVTGFLGHVLLAKLLTTCPDIRKIYVLMRDKRNRSINDRLQDLMNEGIFEKLLTDRPNFNQKVGAIMGDCLKPNLGISEKDQKIMQEEVNIVFHVAATVKFDAPLREAVHTNVRSTRDLLEIAKNMKHLKAFVHVSTAFSYCVDRKLIEEKFYEPPLPANNLINIIDNLDEITANQISSQLLHVFPNTYVYTKAVTEELYSSKTLNLPVAIFRPAIVISTATEPVPGWINNTYGPTGIVAAAGMGLLRTLNADRNCIANVVPCDYVINALIASAWFTANRLLEKLAEKSGNAQCYGLLTEEVPIFNYSNSDKKRAITWHEFCHEHELLEPKSPFSATMWSYGLTMNKSKFMHQLYKYIFHYTPAYIVDGFLLLSGRKPKLLDAYRKIHKLTDIISYFSIREWNIDNSHVQLLWSLLTNEDKQKFNFDLGSLNWKDYYRNHFLGIRENILKDKLETIPAAKRKRRILLAVHYGLSFILFSFCFFIVLRFYKKFYRCA